MSEIVGRDAELDSLDVFVGGDGAGARAVLLEGDPGIGKSTLWTASVEAARACGMRVLSVRPVEAERDLALVGLGDLLEGSVDEVLSALSPPRRHALEVALLVEEQDGESADPRALGTAVRDALELLAADGPLLLAIDDLQWFDGASAATLAFALRRLDDQSVRMLLAKRKQDGGWSSALEAALGGTLQRLTVGPLSVGALHRLLRDRLGVTLARQTLLRVHEHSGGNPFYALELARALDTSQAPFDPWQLPETLDDLVRGRIAALPPETRNALAIAAALGSAPESLLQRARVDRTVLEPAFTAGVIERTEGEIRFTHPLLSSLLYRDLGDGRRAVHALVADIGGDEILCARHLALSCDGPEAGVATVLENAAELAGHRGLSAVAAELAEHALRLTPTGDDARAHRALAAARAHQAAGEWPRAHAILSELIAADDVGDIRAEALILLAELESVDRAAGLLEAALESAGSRADILSIVRCRLASATRFRDGYQQAREHARIALAFADELDDDALRVPALAALASNGVHVGDVEAIHQARRAREIARKANDTVLSRVAAASLGEVLTLTMRHDEARALLESEYAYWRDRDEPWSAGILWSLAWIDIFTGHWQRAEDQAARARDLLSQYGLEIPQHHLPLSWIAVHRGELETARRISSYALELAEEQLRLHPPIHLSILGLASWWEGDATTAAGWFDQADRQAAALNWYEPAWRLWTPDHVEALLELGKVDDAAGLVDVLEADATRLERAWALAQVTRSRGLIAAARGELAPALTLLSDAVAAHEAAGDPLGRARALLALGTIRLRDRQKRAAREALEAALDAFRHIGAAPLAAKASAELERIGGRTRADGLTPAEQRVAALVADGRTNREVAAALFLGERTVASHLTHIYAKLGVRSRTELARTLAGKVQTF